MKHPLNGALLRIDRARKHLNILRREVEKFRNVNTNTVAAHIDPKVGRHIYLGVEHPGPPLPPLLSILVGEIIYNLRAALDYLVFVLAWLDSGEIQEGTQFPIDDKPKIFAERRTGKRPYLAGVSASHIDRIESLQPYKGCVWTRRLRTLSNPDKHRELTGIGYVAESVLRVEKISRKQAKVDGSNMDVDLKTILHVAFEDGTPVIDELEVLQSEVAALLEEFKAELFSIKSG